MDVEEGEGTNNGPQLYDLLITTANKQIISSTESPMEPRLPKPAQAAPAPPSNLVIVANQPDSSTDPPLYLPNRGIPSHTTPSFTHLLNPLGNATANQDYPQSIPELQARSVGRSIRTDKIQGAPGSKRDGNAGMEAAGGGTTAGAEVESITVMK